MSENGSVNYQEGMSEVSHRNLDAAGDDHPFGEQPRQFEANMKTLIRRVADDLYESWEATIREYLANAETACLRTQEYVETGESDMFDGDLIVDDSYQPKIEIEWNKEENRLTIEDNGIGMSANVVDKVFRQIGRSTNRDSGGYSGAFGQGVLSFCKLTGLDNAMIMTSHSRLNGDNASYYVTLGGVEPVMGSLPDDKYGTVFQMTPKDSFDIRETVADYAEYLRVPLRYEEIGDDGSVEFQEDYGDKKLYDNYDENRICIGVKKPGFFEAYVSPEADGETLLLSMDIDRNDGKYSSNQHTAPWSFDVRLLDESGKVVESTNGNEGLMPVPRSDYRSMLKEARGEYITEALLLNDDVLAQELEQAADAEYEGGMVVSDEVYESIQSGSVAVPPNSYLPKSEVSEGDVPGKTMVISGPNKGKTLVSEEAWDDLPEGRAAQYVPEDSLEPYDLDSGEGDLTLPQPTSDRDRLQSHETFWRYVAAQLGAEFDATVKQVTEAVDSTGSVQDAVTALSNEDITVTAGQLSE